MENRVSADTGVSQLHSFLLTTSIKGVSRLTKAKRPLFRILWAVFVLLGFAATLYLVTRLVVQYLANHVSVVMTEARDANQTFPAITLCNLNPVANTNLTIEHVRDYMETARRMGASGKLHKGNLLDPAAFYANVAPYLNNDTARQFLVACQWDLQQDGQRRCLDEDSQMFMYQARLGYCMTFTPQTTIDVVVGFSAILYLDNNLNFQLPFYQLTINTPLSIGAFLFVHQRNTLPDLSRGTVLLAGRNTRMDLSVQQRFRQPHPYSNCTDQTMLPQAHNYRYTQQTCLDLCSQTTIMNTCGCISAQVPYIPTLKAYCGQPLCGVILHGNLSQAVERFIREQHCIRQVLAEPECCDRHCPAACEEELYIATKESTDWPHPALQLAFWEGYVKNKPYSYRFEAYQDMSPSINDTPTESGQKLRQIKDDDLLTDNFLQVSLSMWLTWIQFCESCIRSLAHVLQHRGSIYGIFNKVMAEYMYADRKVNWYHNAIKQ